MKRQLLLVRHCAVDERFKGVCYGGQTDVGLSDQGIAQNKALAARLARLGPARIFHSGLSRTRVLAEEIAALVDAPLLEDKRLTELDFGTWEGRSWDEIFGEVGHDMVRLMSEPETYAPHGGETIFEVRDRVMGWHGELSTLGVADGALTGVTIAISHGGPISALLGTLGNVSVSDWPGLIPAYGEVRDVG